MQIFNQRIIHSVLWGAIGFGVGFALVGAIFEAIYLNIPDFDAGLKIGALLYALAGGIGGALLGFASKSRNKIGLFSLAGALGCGLGYYGAFSFYSVYVEPRMALSNFLAFAIVDSMRYAIIGAFIGVSLGSIQKNWGQAAWLALAGAGGFGLGYLTLISISYVIGPLRELDIITLMIIFSISNAIIGICGGATLGLALGRHQADILLPPSAGIRAEGKTALT
ncbi:MAG: hypothetical protein HYZ49_11225 [Chloroflexi bacterium]|nr:hypothetical protein [Chloroflexota bacterium]